METINLFQAASALPKLVEAIESGQEREIVITRDGQPAARLVPVEPLPSGVRLGVAKGHFEVPDTIDAHNDEVARLFQGGSPS